MPNADTMCISVVRYSGSDDNCRSFYRLDGLLTGVQHSQTHSIEHGIEQVSISIAIFLFIVVVPVITFVVFS